MRLSILAWAVLAAEIYLVSTGWANPAHSNEFIVGSMIGCSFGIFLAEAIHGRKS